MVCRSRQKLPWQRGVTEESWSAPGKLEGGGKEAGRGREAREHEAQGRGWGQGMPFQDTFPVTHSLHLCPDTYSFLHLPICHQIGTSQGTDPLTRSELLWSNQFPNPTSEPCWATSQAHSILLALVHHHLSRLFLLQGEGKTQGLGVEMRRVTAEGLTLLLRESWRGWPGSGGGRITAKKANGGRFIFRGKEIRFPRRVQRSKGRGGKGANALVPTSSVGSPQQEDRVPGVCL